MQRLLDTTCESVQASQSVIEEILELGQWDRETPTVKAYIDDFNVVEKVRASTALGHFTEEKTTYQVCSSQSQDIFVNVKTTAEDIGMIVNDKKTQLLCISHKGKDLRSFIYADDPPSKIVSKDSLKILGFTFGNTPDVALNTREIIKKFITNLWSMRFLKQAGMGQSDLLFTYKTLLRPTLDFAAPTYHPLLNSEQTNELERLQMRAMKIVYGEAVSYREVVENGCIETLFERRETLLEKFALKTEKNENFREKWFVENHLVTHDLRHREKYFIPRFRTERAYRSPIIAMRKLLNSHYA